MLASDSYLCITSDLPVVSYGCLRSAWDKLRSLLIVGKLVNFSFSSMRSRSILLFWAMRSKSYELIYSVSVWWFSDVGDWRLWCIMSLRLYCLLLPKLDIFFFIFSKLRWDKMLISFNLRSSVSFYWLSLFLMRVFKVWWCVVALSWAFLFSM